MAKPITIDLNCDMGEGFGAWKMGNDAALMPLISSANIACGFHAGDAKTMLETVQLALKYDVAIGAHPALPDLQGFGRRSMLLPAEEVYSLVLYQIGALRAIAEAEGGTLHHVKPHGALYNMAAQNQALAEAIAKAAAKSDLVLYGLSGSALEHAAKLYDLRFCGEAFCDRRYQKNGALVSRDLPEAVIEDPAQAARQALQIVQNQPIETIEGELLEVSCQTLCIHGDAPHALAIAQAVRQSLQAEGFRIAAV